MPVPSIVETKLDPQDSAGSPTSTTIVLDTPPTVDQVVLVILYWDENPGTITPPSNLTFTPIAALSNGDSELYHASYWAAGDGIEDTFVVSWANSQACWCGTIVLDSDTAGPVDVVATNPSTSFATGLTSPSVATSVDDTLVIRAMGVHSLATITSPGGLDELFNSASGASSTAQDIRVAVTTETQATAGATGTELFVASTGRKSIGVTFAVIPAPVPVSPIDGFSLTRYMGAYVIGGYGEGEPPPATLELPTVDLSMVPIAPSFVTEGDLVLPTVDLSMQPVAPTLVGIAALELPTVDLSMQPVAPWLIHSVDLAEAADQPVEFVAIAVDVRTGLRLGEVPIEAGTYTEQLNAPGTAPVTVNLDRLSFPIRSGRTALWILRNGVPDWAGLVWARTTDTARSTMALTVKGWHEYFRHRHLKVNLTFTGQDQADIARGIIAHAQSVSGGNVGIVTDGTNLTGRTRTRNYLGRERPAYAELLEQLAAVADGFDFSYAPVLTQDQLEVHLRIQYPAVGRDTGIVFEEGSNCTATSVGETAEEMANTVDSTGAGEGTALLARTAADPNALNTYPLLDHIDPRTSVTDPTTLQGHADRELTRRLDPQVTATIEVFRDAHPLPGTYRVGDRVRWIYADQIDNYDRTMRIASRTVDTATDITTLALVPVDPVVTPDLQVMFRESQRRLGELERARLATI